MGFFYVLNYLYCMKVKSRLNEALGVPEGILEVAEEVYDKIANTNFRYNIVEVFEDSSGKGNIISTPFKIGDLTFKKIRLIINVMPNPEVNIVLLNGLSILHESRMTGIGTLSNVKNDNLVVLINFYCPGDEYGDPTISDKQIKSEIKNHFTQKKNTLISSIAHELKHGYDINKRPYENVINRSKYHASNKFILFPVKQIDDFYYSLYFVSMAETLVRPAEVMSLIKSQQITKKDFLNFIKSNETYQILNYIRNMTFEKFYNELLGDVSNIKKTLSEIKKNLGYNFNITNKSDEEIVNLFLNIIKDLFEKHSMDFIKEIISETPFLNIFFSENVKFYLMDISKKLKKNISGKEYFKSEIENNAKKANLVIRKLAKLYAMAK